MHKMLEYIDDELKDLEKKVEKEGRLSRTEIEDGKNLAKFEMALLTNERMKAEKGYSGTYWDGRYYYDGETSMNGMSNARGRGSNAKRDSMGRYSSERGYSRADAKEDFLMEVEELIEKAPDEHTRKKFERFVNEMR